MRESGLIFGGYGNARPVPVGNRLRRTIMPRGCAITAPSRMRRIPGSGIGFAETRVDGWACLRLERERDTGQFTTISHRGARRPVPAAAERRGGGGVPGGAPAVEVEALAAGTGGVLPGYIADSCRIAGEDETAMIVEWPGKVLIGAGDRAVTVHSALAACKGVFVLVRENRGLNCLYCVGGLLTQPPSPALPPLRQGKGAYQRTPILLIQPPSPAAAGEGLGMGAKLRNLPLPSPVGNGGRAGDGGPGYALRHR